MNIFNGLSVDSFTVREKLQVHGVNVSSEALPHFFKNPLKDITVSCADT